jgi:hypothetical protein
MKGLVLKDDGGYDRFKGEMNPAIFEEFVGQVLDRDVTPAIWEPFAGHTGLSKTQDFAADLDGLTVVSFDVAPCDLRVRKADSTKEGPGRFVGGVLFHPSYYGSAPLSDVAGEVSLLENEEEYRNALGRTVDFARMFLEPGGLVCAVGRGYRHAGKNVRLDVWFVEMFEEAGLVLSEVWQSEPDVALVFQSEKGA